MARELLPHQIVERSLMKTYRKTIWHPFVLACREYDLLAPGDRIAVCVSGGKDSFLLAKLQRDSLAHDVDTLVHIVQTVLTTPDAPVTLAAVVADKLESIIGGFENLTAQADLIAMLESDSATMPKGGTAVQRQVLDVGKADLGRLAGLVIVACVSHNLFSFWFVVVCFLYLYYIMD